MYIGIGSMLEKQKYKKYIRRIWKDGSIKGAPPRNNGNFVCQAA